MNLRILVTGARAPAALELCRALHAGGHTVIAADSLRLPLCAWSNTVDRTLVLPPPRHAPLDFLAALKHSVREHRIDLIVPTCEEVFYLAHFRDSLADLCEVLVDSIDTLRRLHHKRTFLEACPEGAVHRPETWDAPSLDGALAMLEANPQLVFKPVFSRFATFTRVCPDPSALKEAWQAHPGPWIAQEFIPGREFCTYAVAREGRLLAHACYEPVLRFGQGSGIYFAPRQRPEITEFTRALVQRERFNGQIGFDFREDARGVFVIDCNPRATSGIHLLRPVATDLSNAVTGAGDTLLVEPPANTPSAMVALAIGSVAVSAARQAGGIGEFTALWKEADDVMHLRGDRRPGWGQFISYATILALSIARRQSLLKTSTADIEWDGTPLPCL